MHQVDYHPRVSKDIKKIDISVARDIDEKHIPDILQDPYSGESLKGSLAGMFSHHFKKNKVEYRIAYLIQESSNLVTVLKIGKRENFYRDLERRLS